MRKLFPLLILALMISSCTQEEFSVSDERLELSSDALVFTALFSAPESTYTFRASSPYGGLVWEGSMNGEGEMKSSDSLEITDGASFPEGDYTFTIYSDSGTELTLSVPFESPLLPTI